MSVDVFTKIAVHTCVSVCVCVCLCKCHNIIFGFIKAHLRIIIINI